MANRKTIDRPPKKANCPKMSRELWRIGSPTVALYQILFAVGEALSKILFQLQKVMFFNSKNYAALLTPWKNEPIPLQWMDESRVAVSRDITTRHMETKIFATRQEMGAAAANAAAEFLRQTLEKQETVRAVFAAAPSQNEMLAALIEAEGIDWNRVEAFHMDEYVGLDSAAPQRFARFLKERLFDRLPFRAVYLIETDFPEPAERYEKLLRLAPIDLVCLGIGENGHIAFNDPPVADFSDPVWVKIVELDEICRQQQVNDGCFPTLDDVPRQAMTLTIPALLSGRRLVCTAPGLTKRQAVLQTLKYPISTACPATILRNHSDCTLFLDKESAQLAIAELRS